MYDSFDMELLPNHIVINEIFLIFLIYFVLPFCANIITHHSVKTFIYNFHSERSNKNVYYLVQKTEN